MTGKEAFMQEVKNSFSPETTDEEIICFLKSYPGGEKSAQVLVMGYMVTRLIHTMVNKTPYQSLLTVMESLYEAYEEQSDET